MRLVRSGYCGLQSCCCLFNTHVDNVQTFITAHSLPSDVNIIPKTLNIIHAIEIVLSKNSTNVLKTAFNNACSRDHKKRNPIGKSLFKVYSESVTKLVFDTWEIIV